MAEGLYSIVDLMKFLSTEERPVKSSEFTAFWNSCTEQEKDEFKNTELPQMEKKD